MRLDDVLSLLAHHVSQDEFDSEAVNEELQTHPDSYAIQNQLEGSITNGHLTSDYWYQVTEQTTPADFCVAFGTLLNELAQNGILAYIEGFPANWSFDSLRLWAYTEEWFLISQDEDLLLMDDYLTPMLLEIAAEANCPKRHYILSTVEHGIRDKAYALVGKPEFDVFINQIAVHIPAAEKAQTSGLVDYLRRLQGYIVRAKVTRAGAVQRGADLTRCVAPELSAVQVEREGRWWRVVVHGHRAKTLKISALDGKISAE